MYTTETEVLQNCTVEGNHIKLPAQQLDRKLYQDVAKSLNLIGGKWKGGKTAAFVFEQDPTDLLAQISGGQARNLKKEIQFFETPETLADQLVQMAELYDDKLDKVCEPSAGRGRIVKAIQQAFPKIRIFGYEIDDLNCSFLNKLPGFHLLDGDFLLSNKKWDRFVMNPPFAKGQSYDHIMHAYKLLNRFGVLVSVCDISWTFVEKGKGNAFRQWIDDSGENGEAWDRMSRSDLNVYDLIRSNGDRVFIELVPAETFKESGTNIRTCIIKIEKRVE